jgi:hypothetical protein
MASPGDNLIAFSGWLRKNKVVSLVSGTGVLAAVESVAKWVHFEGFTLSPAYLLSAVVGLLFLGIALFCIWIATNPQLESPDKNNSQRFSPTTPKVAKFCIAPVLVVGVAAVFFTMPAPRVPVADLRSLLAAVDKQATKFKSAGNTYTTYLAYQEARSNDPSGFWVNPDVWETVATVEQDNSNLKAAIEADTRLVNQNLAHWQETGHVHGLNLEDVAAVIQHYARADNLYNKIEGFRPQSYQDQKDLNGWLCTYWELILKGDPAENRLREWLKLPKRS